MTPERSAYDDLATPAEMHADASQAGRHLEQAANRVGRPAPSIHFDEQPRETPKRDIEISDAAARLAAAIYG